MPQATLSAGDLGVHLRHAFAIPAGDNGLMTPLALRIVLATGLLVGAGGLARAQDEFSAPPKKSARETVCDLIDGAAAVHRLPVEFFTRLVWRESSFVADAVSPKGAQGIAQFMPGTAAIRGLADPFDPRKAIPASAAYLSDLSAQFGNLGLAAAAYNAGEKRVTDWMAGDRGLPLETRDYVLFITGRDAEDWKADATGGETAPRTAKEAVACLEIAGLLAKGAGAAVVPPSIESAPWAPWGVQLVGNFSQGRALASYRALQQRHSKVIGDAKPLIVRSVMRSRGRAPFYEIRLPAATRGDANELCDRLHAAGAACVVVRNAR